MFRNPKAPWWLRSLSVLMLVLSTLTFFISGLLWPFVGSVCVLVAAAAYAKATGRY